MKTILTASATLLSATLCWAAPEPIKFDIYQGSATVSFSAEVNGEQVLTIPGAFNPESLQIVSVRGANLISFKAESITNDSDKSPYYLEDAIKEFDNLNATLNIKTAKLSSLELSAAILDSITGENIKPAEIASLLATVSGLREKNAKELIALNNEILLLKAIIKDKEEYIKSRLPVGFKKLTTLTIKLSGKGTVIFKADTESASWLPKYKMNLNTRTGVIDTVFSVSIKQNTGLIWKGAMELYSNKPPVGIYYQPLEPLLVYLRKEMPVPYSEKLQDGMMLESASPVNSEIMRKSSVGINQAPAITDAGLYFKLNATIEGSGLETIVPVDKFNITSESGFELTPDYSRYAILTARIKTLPKPLLDASAEFFIDSVYSAAGLVEAMPQGGKMVIPFGESKNIYAVKTRQISKKQSSFIKGAMLDGYSISILNGLDRPISLTVNDRIPFPTDSKISVTNVTIEPKVKESKDGVYKWELQLQSRETKQINVDYEIKFPSDARISFR